jgi:hypothetical protein
MIIRAENSLNRQAESALDLLHVPAAPSPVATDAPIAAPRRRPRTIRSVETLKKRKQGSSRSSPLLE